LFKSLMKEKQFGLTLEIKQNRFCAFERFQKRMSPVCKAEIAKVSQPNCK